MLNNTGNQHLKNLSPSAQISVTQKPSLQKYLQSPFSISWSKLADIFKDAQALSQPEVIATNLSQQFKPDSQQYESDSIREQNLYPHFADRVDPSLYYSIFFSPKGF